MAFKSGSISLGTTRVIKGIVPLAGLFSVQLLSADLSANTDFNLQFSNDGTNWGNAKEAGKLISKSNLSKTEQDKLKWFYDKTSQEVKSNIPFIMRCFQEFMDDIVLDAKAEIDSALLHTIISTGLKTLGEAANDDSELKIK